MTDRRIPSILQRSSCIGALFAFFALASFFFPRFSLHARIFLSNSDAVHSPDLLISSRQYFQASFKWDELVQHL